MIGGQRNEFQSSNYSLDGIRKSLAAAAAAKQAGRRRSRLDSFVGARNISQLAD